MENIIIHQICRFSTSADVCSRKRVLRFCGWRGENHWCVFVSESSLRLRMHTLHQSYALSVSVELHLHVETTSAGRVEQVYCHSQKQSTFACQHCYWNYELLSSNCSMESMIWTPQMLKPLTLSRKVKSPLGWFNKFSISSLKCWNAGSGTLVSCTIKGIIHPNSKFQHSCPQDIVNVWHIFKSIVLF